MRHPYADFVHQVERPVRYLGGEYLSVQKDPAKVDAHVVLAFPDTYEIGMSHLGTKILYGRLNADERIFCERAFTPWTDMEAALRARGLPLLSLESARPLCAFDVVGISLQYELTYTNVLTLLDLGGIARRAVDRQDDAPLVLGGGPTATHPEPMAPFFDAFFVGEAEAELPELVKTWSALRRAGTPRQEALVELAARFAVYVPSLYATAIDEATGLVVVGAPVDRRVPARVKRAVVPDLDTYPFPTRSPVPYAEAVFDRAAIEIARGCTEGCRFCQAGMIYRPVRERSPEAIVDAIVGNVAAGGYDETSLTCLSTADYSCVTPLVKEVMAKLREKKVALAVSSLRAYGLNEELLDEMASVRATGLTFAPEAGTQRMRDVINKNVTEAHIQESAERVFRKGWSRIKLYFMIGQPTETDEDVRGVVETGQRVLAAGRAQIGAAAEVTVSVSSHVPKPHTPFQWCAMDTVAELERKQALLRHTADGLRPKVKLKTHDRGISHVEGIMARGDRRVAEAIEWAWRDGARFDGWDELFELERWQRAFAHVGIEPERYLGTIPVRARLPWDHIDVGLDDGFLLAEYRKALKDRLSPPCGKPMGELLHHTNLADAEADRRRLVCYDCGVACDLGEMKAARKAYLVQLGALSPAPPRAEGEGGSRRPPGPRRPSPTFVQGVGTRYRLRYTKLGRSAFISHLDVSRLLQRLFRRADLEVIYSRGFHPKPLMTFGPALGLGVPSLGELVDVRLGGDHDAATLVERLAQVAPEGLSPVAMRRLPDGAPVLSKVIDAAEWVIAPRPDGIRLDVERLARVADTFMARERAPHFRPAYGDHAAREIDVRAHVSALAPCDPAEAPALARALDLDLGAHPDAAPPLLIARVAAGGQGSVRPGELCAALGFAGAHVARLGLVGSDAAGERIDPLSDAALAAPLPLAAAQVATHRDSVDADVDTEALFEVTP
jgi:radical SAM family uncharacterized protein/radical SAM-linked protein